MDIVPSKTLSLSLPLSQVHSIQGVLCYGKTLQEMDDYIMVLLL